MEDAFIINGGKPLKGSVTLSGAKNIALKVIIAALLFDSKVTLQNVPKINDIDELIHLLELSGVDISRDKDTLIIDPLSLQKNKIDLLHASKIRVSFLLFAPLLMRFGRAIIPNPGGCRIGARSIDRVIEGMKTLGVNVEYDSKTGYYDATIKDKVAGNYIFNKATHTGTEMMIMLSVFCRGKVRIENVAKEPEIDDLINMLNAGGAKIARQENSITIEGVEKLVQPEPFQISSDRVECVTFAVLALATGGDVTIQKIPDQFVETFVDFLRKTGAGVEKISEGVWRFFSQKLNPISIETLPHPGFLTDWQPLWAVLMTQAEGQSQIHERIFENRFSYVEELQKLGAKIEFISPKVENPNEFYFFNYDRSKEYTQAIEISGPQKLHGGVVTVSDLRAGATLAIAALIATGESYVKGVHHLERGYENFVEKVTQLGGDIRKI